MLGAVATGTTQRYQVWGRGSGASDESGLVATRFTYWCSMSTSQQAKRARKKARNDKRYIPQHGPKVTIVKVKAKK